MSNEDHFGDLTNFYSGDMSTSGLTNLATDESM